MSTVCKIATTASEADVCIALRKFFGDSGREFHESSTEWPAAAKGDEFDSGGDFPTMFSVRQVTDAVTEICFNSFSKVRELASVLSKTLGVPVVVNEYQSVSSASYWALHTQGTLLRAIEAGDGVVTSQEGEALAFEGAEPGHDIGESGDPCIVFDDEDQSRYNHAVQIPVDVYQEYGPGWHNFELPRPSRNSGEKRWWRFWERGSR